MTKEINWKTGDRARLIRGPGEADTKEGWAEAAYELSKSYIEGYNVEFDYSKTRPIGAPLKTSGRCAPGYLGLLDTHEYITVIARSLGSLESINQTS